MADKSEKAPEIKNQDSGHFQPQYHPYYPPPIQPPQKWWNRKRFSIVEMVAIVLFVFLFFSPLSFLLLMNMGAPEAEFRNLMDGTYIMNNGTYHGEKADVWTNTDLRITVDVISGGNIDVLVMSESQYRSFQNNSELIGYIEIVKNISSTSFIVHAGEPCYIVIDNSDLPVITDDAVPTGQSTVHLNIERKDYYWD